MKSTHKIFTMIALAALTVIIAMSACLWSFGQIKQAAQAKNHIHLVMEGADQLLSTLKDAETGQRGYLLTGDEAFLAPYTLAKKQIPNEFKALHQLTKIAASQQYLDQAGLLIDAKMAHLDKLLTLSKHNGFELAVAEMRKGQGRQLMDSVRNELDLFNRLEKSAAIDLEVKLQSTLQRLFHIMILAGILWSLFAIALIYLTFHRGQQKLKDIAHTETQSLLKVQEDANQKLAHINSNLEISEERLAVTLNSIGDAVISTDEKGMVTMLNPLGEKLTGWTKQEAQGRHVSDIFHIINQETRVPSVIPVLKTLAQGSIQGMANHTILISRDGSESAIADSCAPIRERNGELVGTIMVFRDVTKEYATQRALSDSAALIEAILNTVADGIITFHASDGTIQTLNRTAENMFGFEDVELIGKNFSVLIPELDQHKCNGTLSDYKASADAIAAGHGREVTGIRKGNLPFPVEIAVNEMWLGGTRFFTCILRDITVRKQSEIDQAKMAKLLIDKNAELEQATFLAEKANLAKSDFLSSMSHELRTPLSAILGFAQLIETGTPSPTSNQQKSVDQILKAGWYLLDLINEILDLALIESGKMAISLEPVSLAEVMRECKAMIEPEAQKRNITIHFHELEKPYFVKADHTRVKQIMINLLSNAIKYNSPNGTVNVTYTLIDISEIRICIEDTGAGLPPELIAQLFQPFNRLGQNAKAEVGTGIGLVVCKRLVELMNGKIGVQSTVGKGSTFWIELNLIVDTQAAEISHAQARALNQSANTTQSSSSFHTVLYVEDNPANLMLVDDIVARRSDIQLLSAINGKQGLQMARALLPDLILMDINLPDISGMDAMKMLAKDPKTAHIPVIALSANALPHDIQKGLHAGFFRYLTKPIKVIELVDAIDSALALAKSEATIVAQQE